MKTCLAIQSLRSCNLEEAAAITRALGFNAIDLDGVMDTTLKREGILNVKTDEINRVKSLGLIVPNIHWTFSVGSFLPALNDPDPNVRVSNKEQVKRLIEFCNKAEILSILLLPGVFLPGQSQTDAYALSAEALSEFLLIANEADIALYIEPHAGSSYESPESVLWLLDQVPGLKIVLDYSHFVCQGYPQPALDPLIPHTGHVHLRQAKSGLLQTKLEDGTVNFALVLDQLQQVGYDGYLCVEYVHQDYIGADNVDVITETIKMRDFLKNHLQME